ncbi:lysozyme [Sphingopyxis sp.]|jgi:lysozyme|uniref:lysozyme n=1 Tax=Sphingopyxis sp. TaxID=1908224 RepID=UPI003F6F5CA3
MTTPNKPAPRAGKLTLAAVVGPLAAIALLTLTPAEESGRKVNVQLAPDGTATVRHVSGKQYLRVYLDAVGVPTACDGLTDRQKIKLGMAFTEAQCVDMLEAALVEYAVQVKRCTPAIFAPGTENQRIAAVLLTYNIGWPRWCNSTADRLFDAGKFRQACDWFLPWNKAGGRVLRGLVARRDRERAICLKGL